MKKKLPIRNKSKDNPYVLGYDEDKNTYIVEFTDNKKIIHKVEISDKVYEAFDKFELEDVSELHKYSKHIEHSELCEETLNKRALHKNISVEEEVEKLILNEQLKKAINSLPDIQKNRIKKYFFEDKTFEQIANEEKCTKRAVKFSIDIALEKISKILKN